MSPGRWWSQLDHSPVFRDDHPAGTLAGTLVAVVLLVIAAVLLVALGVHM